MLLSGTLLCSLIKIMLRYDSILNVIFSQMTLCEGLICIHTEVHQFLMGVCVCACDLLYIQIAMCESHAPPVTIVLDENWRCKCSHLLLI